MKMKFTLLLYFSLYASVSFACLSTTQFKIFPIGISNSKIITFDVYIYRGGYIDKKNTDDFVFPKTSWSLRSFIGIYDLNGKLVSKEALDVSEIRKDEYLKGLKISYKKGIQTIKSKFKNLTFFEPEYISFCNFQKKCEILKIIHTKKTQKNFLIYQNKKQLINLNRFKEFKRSMQYSDDLTSYYISSTRTYKTDKFEIVIGHLQNGQGLSTHQTSINKNNSENNKLENKPDFEFNKLENAVYKEPLLHHAYGFDFLIVSKKQKR